MGRFVTPSLTADELEIKRLAQKRVDAIVRKINKYVEANNVARYAVPAVLRKESAEAWYNYRVTCISAKERAHRKWFIDNHIPASPIMGEEFYTYTYEAYRDNKRQCKLKGGLTVVECILGAYERYNFVGCHVLAYKGNKRPIPTTVEENVVNEVINLAPVLSTAKHQAHVLVYHGQLGVVEEPMDTLGYHDRGFHYAHVRRYNNAPPVVEVVKHNSHVVAYIKADAKHNAHAKAYRSFEIKRKARHSAHVAAYDVSLLENKQVQESPAPALKRERPSRVGGSLSIGHFYLFRWTHPNSGHSFLKIGVTAENSPYYRALQQGQYTEYTSECLGFKVLPNRESAYKLESFVKSLLKGEMGVVGKDVFGDGYTETVEDTEANAKRILNIINTDF